MRKYSSVYEHLNGGFTTVMKQRFVDEFSGATLDVSKWGFNEASGTGTRAIDQDVIGGGYKMITSSSNGSNYMQLKGGGGTIRAFDAESSAFIAVCRAVTTSDVAFYVGLHEDSYFAADHGSNRSNYRLSHRNNLVGTGNTDSSVAIDYAWHTHSATTDGTNCKYSIDGISKSRSLPISDMLQSLFTSRPIRLSIFPFTEIVISSAVTSGQKSLQGHSRSFNEVLKQSPSITISPEPSGVSVNSPTLQTPNPQPLHLGQVLRAQGTLKCTQAPPR